MGEVECESCGCKDVQSEEMQEIWELKSNWMELKTEVVGEIRVARAGAGRRS